MSYRPISQMIKTIQMTIVTLQCSVISHLKMIADDNTFDRSQLIK